MKKLITKMDKKLLVISIIMALFGLLMIFSASSAKAAIYGNPYSIFIKHAIILVICLIVSIIIITIPITAYKRFINLALYGIIIALIFVFAYGIAINSTKRWLDLGFYNFQPSEFAKVIKAFIIWNYNLPINIYATRFWNNLYYVRYYYSCVFITPNK